MPPSPKESISMKWDFGHPYRLALRCRPFTQEQNICGKGSASASHVGVTPSRKEEAGCGWATVNGRNGNGGGNGNGNGNGKGLSSEQATLLAS